MGRQAKFVSDDKSSAERNLSPRIKKLIGAIVMVMWIAIYALIAMGVAIHVLPHANGLVAFLYYAIAGTVWIIPIGLMLPWMNREPGKRAN
jgi:magnesium-transporting ATPase (P-type)